MDAKEYIQLQFANVRRVSDAVTADLTDQLLQWAPPGTVDSIGVILLHCIGAEDGFVQGNFQHKPLVFQTEGWADMIGVSTIPNPRGGWEEARGAKLSVAPLLEYQQAVRASTDAYLAELTDEELRQQVSFAGSERTVAYMLALSCEHTAHHMGEVSALKGIQGAKGLPF